MDESQQDIISKLKFLGRIGRGEKINVKELTLQSEGYVTAVKRTLWNVDNRNNTMSFIQTTIQAGFNLIGTLSKSHNNNIGNKQIAKSMIQDILKAKSGISNLKTTYSEDTFFCCGIDTYIESVKARIAELRKTSIDLFTNEDDSETDEVDKNIYYDKE
tara:strand:- start:530 stop:1006 length:477 start_codon:yes stop_codon:yes gene_type:complete